MAWNTSLIAWASPSAIAIFWYFSASATFWIASAWPSAFRMAACFSPSAFVISDWRMPSASRIRARFSRSAFICLDIASVMSAGGSMRWISTRVTLTPHLSVASSKICPSAALIFSREVSVSSRLRSPIWLRRFVWASLITAMLKSSTL